MRTNIRVADNTFPVAFLAQSTQSYTRLLTTEDEIWMMFRHIKRDEVIGFNKNLCRKQTEERRKKECGYESTKTYSPPIPIAPYPILRCYSCRKMARLFLPLLFIILLFSPHIIRSFQIYSFPWSESYESRQEQLLRQMREVMFLEMDGNVNKFIVPVSAFPFSYILLFLGYSEGSLYSPADGKPGRRGVYSAGPSRDRV